MLKTSPIHENDQKLLETDDKENKNKYYIDHGI